MRAAELMVREGRALYEAGQDCGAEANMAKLLAADASWQAADACMQTHGGFGFAADYDIERKFRETRLYQVAPISTNLILSLYRRACARPAARLLMTTQANLIDMDRLRGWIGREEVARDMLTPWMAASLRATLDVAKNFPGRAGAMPVMTHWRLAPPIVPTSDLDVDGHPRRGGFLPPVPLPRRMWASGELRFLDFPRKGESVTRRSRIADVSLKNGRSGALVFVAVDHAVSTPRGLAVQERQTIVYRGIQAEASTPPAEAPKGRHRLTLHASEILLQRYSALTFNAHRIHYDRPYCIEVEGYPGLVVQGPLQASLLAEFAADLHGGASPSRFAFRGLAPLFDRQDFTLHAEPAANGFDLWITDARAP